MPDTPTADATHGLSVQHADALWDAVAIPGPTAPTFTEQHERVCRAVAEILDEVAPAVPVVPVSSPPPDQAADRAAELLPAWEAVYEPGNVSDYLIGYANDQDAATGMAEAWMRSQAEVTGRLEWVPDGRLATDRYDRWFELIERHEDGVDTGPGIIVRRRLAAEAQQPEPEAQPESCAQCGKPIRRITGTLTEWWVHVQGGRAFCYPWQPACSPRATPKPTVEAQQPDTETRAERPRCPHCQLPHDLDPDSGVPAVCASIRASLATAPPVHKGGNADEPQESGRV